MIKHRLARITISSGSLLLAVALALFVIGAVAAQSQLPGAPLTDDPANDLRPAWSPDSTQIAFFSIRSGNNDIWVMDADGSNERQLTDDPEDDRRPTWSPDGAYIAFDSDRGGSRNIWVMDASGENPRQLVDTPGLDSFASWSPDGTQIAFFTYESGIMDLWVVAIEDFLQGGEAGQPQQLTTSLADENQNQCTFACHVPAWSPDGTQIAYSGSNHTEIWIVGVDGSNPHSLADSHADPLGGKHHHFPTWTQDGKLLFLSEHITDRQEPVNDVWVMDADGNNATVLFPDIPHGGPFYWSPDGSATIAFHSPRAGNFDIYLVVLGQEELPVVESSAPTEAAVVEEVAGGDETPPEPTDVVAVALASTPSPPTVSEPSAAPGGNLALIWVVAIVVLGGLSVAVYLTRRGRSS